MNKISYQDIIKEKKMYIATPIGKSMWPMLRNRVDTVKLVEITRKLKKYDVILYQRQNQAYVLHRILKVRSNDYVLCGDNQWIKEYGITDGMVIAVVEGFYRKEKYISCSSRWYKLYYKIWVFIRPIRMIFGRAKNLIKRLIND